ncbi:MAG: hypothetical protein FWF94_02230 [Oscillospiraceae bacterium]|nr:hypothetical protein [Oscillospiraceae bacterium]
MNHNIITTPMNINGREFVLAEVTRGMGHIGVLRYSTDAYTATDFFYIENEPIIKIVNPNTSDKHAEKYIMQVSGSEKCSEAIDVRLNASAENLFRYNQDLARSAMPVLELLNTGLYVVHEAQMHPADGSGNFFWNNYCVKKAISGTSETHASIGDANFSPCFLMPTITASSFQIKKMYDIADKIKSGRQFGGVAYHVTGMYSALLKGHHEATAALMENVDFKCLVIEPLSDVVYDSSEQGQSNIEPKIVALSCPYVNIPLEGLSEKTIERFLLTRKHIKPNAFAEIKPKTTKYVRIMSKRAFPGLVYEKAAQLPDCAAVEASSGIDYITEEQLDALSAGEVKYTVIDEEGNEESKTIVSSNYYSSIVTVANYLQVNSFNRFLTFAISLLKNDELTSVHKFIAERLLGIMNPTVHEYFEEVSNRAEQKEGIITDTAGRYRVLWAEHLQRQQNEDESYQIKQRKNTQNMQAITEAKGIASLEAAVKNMGDSPY